MSGIRAVVFDCYGTLLDILTDEGRDTIFSQLSLYLRYYGASIQPGILKSIYYTEKEHYLNTRSEQYPEFDLQAVWRTILLKEGLSNPFLVESCCKIFRLISRERFQLFPDSLPVLKELKRSGFPMVMLSNAQEVFFYAEIDMLGLRQFFNYFIVSSTWGFRNPDPRLFSLACSLCHAAPGEAVYVGDDARVDVKGARSVGMRSVLVDRQQRQRDPEPRPDFYTTSLAQASAWIRGNRGM